MKIIEENREQAFWMFGSVYGIIIGFFNDKIKAR